jgi:hypothetical protein
VKGRLLVKITLIDARVDDVESIAAIIEKCILCGN